jgi:hypothetical protein
MARDQVLHEIGSGNMLRRLLVPRDIGALTVTYQISTGFMRTRDIELSLVQSLPLLRTSLIDIRMFLWQDFSIDFSLPQGQSNHLMS